MSLPEQIYIVFVHIVQCKRPLANRANGDALVFVRGLRAVVTFISEVIQAERVQAAVALERQKIFLPAISLRAMGPHIGKRCHLFINGKNENKKALFLVVFPRPL